MSIKNICIIYANCQNMLLAQCLLKSTLFDQKYLIKRFPVHLLIQEKQTIPDSLLKQAKLFIYQPVKDEHGAASSKHILSKLSPDCQTISFPSLYFTGYFPQHCKNPNKKVVKSIYPFGIIPEGDSNIVSMLQQGKSADEIINNLKDDNFYTQEFLLSNVDSSLAELARRESNLDIQVSQFIKENYQRHRLFYVHNHPTDILGIYITNEILRKIGLPELKVKMLVENCDRGILDKTQVPIYPSVIKHLGLEFARNITYKHDRFCTNNLTFDSYIRNYIGLDMLASKSDSSYYFEGIKHLDKSEYVQAEKFIKEAIRINPNNAAYYRELGYIYLQKKQLNKAELVYRKAIEVSPDWIDFYKSLGSVLTAKEDFTKAALIYKQAIKLDPEDEELCSLLGDTLINLERLDLAEKCYLHATKLNPKKARYYRCLGDIQKKQKSLDQAVAYYEKAIAIAPKNPWLYIHLSETLIEQNKIEEASKNCKRSLNFKQSKRVGFYRRVGDLQVKIGNFDDAINTYKQAIKLNPNHAKQVVSQIRLQIKEATAARDYN